MLTAPKSLLLRGVLFSKLLQSSSKRPCAQKIITSHHFPPNHSINTVRSNAFMHRFPSLPPFKSLRNTSTPISPPQLHLVHTNTYRHTYSQLTMSASETTFGLEASSDLNFVLDDLCLRFLVNLPAVEYESFERLFFAVESAHWFYDDFYRAKHPSLPRLPLKQFAAKMFGHTALLQNHQHEAGRLVAQFQAYKNEVPTCGAALLNPDMSMVVMVRGWGSAARWGFPKGKMSKDETELECAIREVQEETGFNMSTYVQSETDYVDTLSSGRYCRIFVAQNVPIDTVFKTKTRNEISDIKWVPLSVLPDTPKSAKGVKRVNVMSTGPDSVRKDINIYFAQYGVAPFAKKLRSWIRNRKRVRSVNPETSSASLQQKTSSMEGIVSPKFPPMEYGVVEARDLEAELTSSRFPANESRPLPKNGVISLEELESSLPKAPADRGISTTTDPRSGSPENGKSRAPYTSPPPERKSTRADGGNSRREHRRSRKHAEHREDVRNRATFGAGGGNRMTNEERDDLFREYVVRTDRIAAEKGLHDDMWPVPYVTSKDFTRDQLLKAEESNRKSEARSRPLEAANNGKLHGASCGQRERMERIRAKMKAGLVETPPFKFDRAAIIAAMLPPKG